MMLGRQAEQRLNAGTEQDGQQQHPRERAAHLFPSRACLTRRGREYHHARKVKTLVPFMIPLL
jgi:hypothetical protein